MSRAKKAQLSFPGETLHNRGQIHAKCYHEFSVEAGSHSQHLLIKPIWLWLLSLSFSRYYPKFQTFDNIRFYANLEPRLKFDQFILLPGQRSTSRLPNQVAATDLLLSSVCARKSMETFPADVIQTRDRRYVKLASLFSRHWLAVQILPMILSKASGMNVKPTQ